MTPIDNPYNPLQAADDTTPVFGHDEAFAFFRQHLVGTPHRHALVLIGRRGLGKSSVLHQLGHHLDDRYRLCVVNFALFDLTGEEVLIAALVDEIRLALDQAGVSTYRLPDWPAASQSGEAVDLRRWFTAEYLDVAMTALRHRRLVLALDDAHLLIQAVERGVLPADTLLFIAQLAADHSRLDLVFALDASFEDQALGIELLSDPALHFRLSEIGPGDAERLIREPVQDVILYEEGVVERIRALAGGHPFLLQSICRLLFRRSEERNHNAPVTETDLTAIHPAVLEQANEIFAPLWDSASQNEQLTLVALVALHDVAPEGGIAFDAIYGWLVGARYTLNKTQLAAALRSLDYKGLIHTDADGTYSFSAGLIPAWITANTLVGSDTPARRRRDRGQWVQAVGLVAALVIVGAIGAAALSGLFGADKEGDKAAPTLRSTATLSLNLEATRRSDLATQTEQARPTRTPSRTQAPSATASATDTLTPSRTPTGTSTVTPAPTITGTDTATPTPTITASATRTPHPTSTPRPLPTNTPRPAQTATLSPGG